MQRAFRRTDIFGGLQGLTGGCAQTASTKSGRDAGTGAHPGGSLNVRETLTFGAQHDGDHDAEQSLVALLTPSNWKARRQWSAPPLGPRPERPRGTDLQEEVHPKSGPSATTFDFYNVVRRCSREFGSHVVLVGTAKRIHDVGTASVLAHTPGWR